MVISIPLVFRELACKQQLQVRSLIYVISTTVCLKSGMVTILKLHHGFLITSLQIVSMELNKVATKMRKPIWNQVYYGEMATSQRQAKLT